MSTMKLCIKLVDGVLRPVGRVLLCGLTLWGMLAFSFDMAAPVAYAQENTAARALELRGLLPNQYDKHYLGLEPAQRDADIVLTLAIEPADDLALRGMVNFAVLSEDGLRRFLAGADFRQVSISGGSPVQFDEVGNLVQAVIRAPGMGNLTVIVYNESTRPAGYTLTVSGGILIDDSGQTLVADRVVDDSPSEASEESAVEATTATETAAVEEVAETPTVENATGEVAATSTTAQTETDTAQAAATTTVKVDTGPVSARRLSGSLNRQYDRHYLVLEPAERDANISLTFTYEPMDRAELAGAFNFYVLTEDGVRRMVQGESPKNLNLATGFPAPDGPSNVLVANFRAAGSGYYTVVVFNDSTVPGTYVLEVNGALLIDGYQQTNEAAATAAEIAAGAPATNPEPATVTEPAVVESTQPAETGEVVPVSSVSPATPAEGTVAQEAGAAEADVTGEVVTESGALLQVSGELNLPYEHDYLALVPDVVDGRVIVTLAYEPKFARELEGNLNFWVLNEDGLRQVVDGARPVDHNIATGEVVRFGPDFGALQAVFTASGIGEYTVIVYNNSALPATYTLTVQGGTWKVNMDDAQIATLP